MTPHDNHIDDHVLHEYVDNELDSRSRVEVALHLENDGAAKEQVNSYRRLGESLQLLYGHVAREPVPKNMLDVVAARPTRAPARLVWYAVWVAVCLALLAAGWVTRGVVEAQQRDQKLLRQFLTYATESFTYYPLDSDRPEGDRDSPLDPVPDWLHKSLGPDITFSSLDGTALRIVGGRVLPSPTGAAGQLVFRDRRGRLVALYIQRSPAETWFPMLLDTTFSKSITFATRKDLSVLFWAGGAYSYAVVGDIERKELTAIATRLRDDLSS